MESESPRSIFLLFSTGFYQVEALETRKHQGAGLGLSIVKEIVELMDGTIGISSKPGVGTTFTIEFPLADTTTETTH
jgi:signal transduction histidine kinase